MLCVPAMSVGAKFLPRHAGDSLYERDQRAGDDYRWCPEKSLWAAVRTTQAASPRMVQLLSVSSARSLWVVSITMRAMGASATVA